MTDHQPTEQPADPAGKGRLMLNGYGRECWDLGFKAAKEQAEQQSADLRRRIVALESVAHEPVSIPIGNMMARIDALERKLAALCSGDPHTEPPEPPPTRWFPIMGRQVATHLAPIPWTVIAPFDARAKANHSQTLERLAERGGLDPTEAVAVLEDRPWSRMDFDEAERRLREIVAARLKAGGDPNTEETKS